MRRTIGVLVKEGSGAWPPPASVAGRVNFYRGGDAASLQAQTDTLDALVWVPGVAGAEATKAFEALGPNWVHSFSAGVDGLAPFLASEALAARPTPLSNGRGAFSSSLAEYVLAAALHFNKQLPRCARNRDAKRWDAFTMDVLAGKTMGFVGWGHIAKRRRAGEAFDEDDRVPPRPGQGGRRRRARAGRDLRRRGQAGGLQAVGLRRVLPAGHGGGGTSGGPEFAAMKSSGVFISLGRGAAVDEGALVDALATGAIAGAALDVYKVEPLPERALGPRRRGALTAHNADLTADSSSAGTSSPRTSTRGRAAPTSRRPSTPRWAIKALQARGKVPSQDPARSDMRAALLLAAAAADFVFVDFNETQGLRLNGAAATSACEEVEARSHGPHETNLGDGSLDEVYGENDDVMKTVTVDTNPLSSFQDDALAKKAILGHRDRYAAGDRSCAGRGGFESSFTFKVTDHSRHCTRHRDLDFSLELYEKCYVRGGDGLAFVVHKDPNGTAALGGFGGDLGYGGIEASLAVELDMDYNPDVAGAFAGDAAPVDHVEVRSRGRLPNAASGAEALLAPVVFHDLADGLEHLVKVRYLPYVDMAYFANFSVYPAAAPYMVDGGENRRLGLLLVFLDDGVALDSPSMAIPMNLPEMLGLDGDGLAYVGLTASTGKRWQKHDVTSWPDCDEPSDDATRFDYHTASKSSGFNVAFKYTPGRGYGGDVRPVGEGPAVSQMGRVPAARVAGQRRRPGRRAPRDGPPRASVLRC
ncbi:hypothetical protein JL721_8338 [Aureococcus anophagefferens]|nr:hypothetical protein JL721_8338 [Aureococcus anophagefferens]